MKNFYNMHQGIIKFDEKYEALRIKKLQKSLQKRMLINK